MLTDIFFYKELMFFLNRFFLILIIIIWLGSEPYFH